MKGFENWHKRATTNHEKIERGWWQQGNYNIGVATGPGGRIIVLDFDVKKGQLGLEALRRLETEYGLPQSFRVQTPSGGVHVYLRVPERVFIRNSVKTILPGLDVRGNAAGAYVLGPGSTLGGKPYLALGTPSDLADCPEAALKLLLDHQNGNAALETRSRKRDRTPLVELDQPQNIEAAKRYLIDKAPEAIQGAGGDGTTFMVACRVLDCGLSKTEALDLMAEHWNEQKANPPWNLDDLKKKVANAWNYRQDQIGRPQDTRADPADEFDAVDVLVGKDDGPTPKKGFEDDPVDLWADESFPPDLRKGLLPPVLDDWITDEAERKGVERGAVALPGLIACAAAISSRFEVQVKQNDTGHTRSRHLVGRTYRHPSHAKITCAEGGHPAA